MDTKLMQLRVIKIFPTPGAHNNFQLLIIVLFLSIDLEKEMCNCPSLRIKFFNYIRYAIECLNIEERHSFATIYLIICATLPSTMSHNITCDNTQVIK